MKKTGLGYDPDAKTFKFDDDRWNKMIKDCVSTRQLHQDICKVNDQTPFVRREFFGDIEEFEVLYVA